MTESRNVVCTPSSVARVIPADYNDSVYLIKEIRDEVLVPNLEIGKRNPDGANYMGYGVGDLEVDFTYLEAGDPLNNIYHEQWASSPNSVGREAIKADIGANFGAAYAMEIINQASDVVGHDLEEIRKVMDQAEPQHSFGIEGGNEFKVAFGENMAPCLKSFREVYDIIRKEVAVLPEDIQ